MRERITDAKVRAAKPQDKPYQIHDPDGLILRVQPSGVKTFLVVWARGKTKALGRAGVLTVEQGRMKARNVLNEVSQQGEPATRGKGERMSLGDFITEHYRPWAVANLRTAEATLARLRACFEAEFYDKRLTELNPWIIEKWRSQRTKDGTRKTTINRDVGALRSALAHAVEWTLLKVHPLSKVVPMKTDDSQIVRYLAPEEERRLRAALRARDDRARHERLTARKARGGVYCEIHPEIRPEEFTDHLHVAVIVSLNTGLRQGELLSLTWQHVSFERRMLSVQGHTAKSGKTRHIPLNAEAVDVLMRWHSQQGAPAEGLLFPNRAASRITELKTAWSNLLRAARIDNFRWHDMRHHFASRLVMVGVDLNTVRELLGHGDIKMTLRYAHLAPEHKAAAVERLVATLDHPRHG